MLKTSGTQFALTFFVALVWQPVSLAADTWNEPFPGVRHLWRQLPDQNIHVAVVDLCRAGVSLRATQSSERKRTVSAFGNLVGAELAINGSFFRFSDYLPTGLAIGDGQPWPGAADVPGFGAIIAGEERVDIRQMDEPIALEGWMTQAVGGRPTVLHDNVVYPQVHDTTLCTPRHPRTAVGLSKDKRTLFIAVVDGRAPGRAGFTCGEVGQFMKDLGAYWALNMDGGGSSTLWFKGAGVLNHPSDGTERVVGNHLAVFAKGQGRSPSCDRSLDEALYQTSAFEGAGGSDIDGDGRADACARDSSGLTCSTSKGTALNAPFAGPALPDSLGWFWPTYSSSLRLGDLNGDGRADACARFTDGLHCWPSTGTGFGAEWKLTEVAGLAWNDIDNAATLRLGDLTGDGKADVCLRGDDGLSCWPSTGTGFGPRIAGPAWSNAEGFEHPSLFGTIALGDVNGDGKADACARTHTTYDCYLSNGAGFPTKVVGPALPTLYGFAFARYWSTLRLADVNADGRADLCFRTSTQFECHLSTGAGFAAAASGTVAMADNAGWGLHEHYSTLRLADIDGDRDLDVCARTGFGLLCWPWTGAGFSAQAVVGPPVTQGSWDDIAYYRSFRMGDVTGDGRADFCSRSGFGLICWASLGASFSNAAFGGAPWAGGVWDNIVYNATLRLGGPAPKVVTPPPHPPPTPPPPTPRDAGPLPVDSGFSDEAALFSDVVEGEPVPTPSLSPLAGPVETPPVRGNVWGGCASVPTQAIGLAALPWVFLRGRRKSAAATSPKAT